MEDFLFECCELFDKTLLFQMYRNKKEKTIKTKIVEGSLQKDVQALKAFTQLWEDTKEGEN